MTVQGPAGALTQYEHHAVELAGDLYTFIAQRVAGDGPSRDDDLAELRAHIHGIQHAVMAQAAARLHPHRYRLLGGELPGSTTDPTATYGIRGHLPMTAQEHAVARRLAEAAPLITAAEAARLITAAEAPRPEGGS